jgi:hypothetical protein
MQIHAGHEPADRRAVLHQESDVNVRAIFVFGAGLFVTLAIVYVAVWLLFRVLSHRADESVSRRDYPLAEEQGVRLPPEPRLQTTPREDLRQLLAAEDEILNGYRWVDRNAGIVRIPIEEAMRLTLERGFPSRSASQDEKR